MRLYICLFTCICNCVYICNHALQLAWFMIYLIYHTYHCITPIDFQGFVGGWPGALRDLWVPRDRRVERPPPQRHNTGYGCLWTRLLLSGPGSPVATHRYSTVYSIIVHLGLGDWQYFFWSMSFFDVRWYALIASHRIDCVALWLSFKNLIVCLYLINLLCGCLIYHCVYRLLEFSIWVSLLVKCDVCAAGWFVE